MKRRVFVVAALVCAALGLVLQTPPAGANGTETLGPPSITLKTGTGVAHGGVSMLNPGAPPYTNAPSAKLNVAVPAGVTVKQVLLHWNGDHLPSGAGDNNIKVNGVSVTGALIGGPTLFIGTGATPHDVSSYRADITSKNFVKPGANVLTISGMNFSQANNGISAMVIYDDGSAAHKIVLRDGVDVAFSGFPEPRKSTKPQTFTVPASLSPRVANVHLSVGSVDPDRPNKVRITSGGQTQTFTNPLHDTSGPEWDAITLPANIPAGATSVKVQVFSESDGSPNLPASLVWVTAILDAPPAVICKPSTATPSATGRAWNVQASLVNGSIKVPPTLDTDKKNPDFLAGLALPPGPGAIINDTLLSVSNDPEVNPKFATDIAMSLVNGLNVNLGPNAMISASTVLMRSTSSATGFGASSSFDGSVIQDLRVGSVVVGDVKQPTQIDITVPVLNTLLGRVHVFETVAASGAAGGEPQPFGGSPTQDGVYRSGLSMNALHIELFVPGTQIVLSDIVIGHAESKAQFPSAQKCRPQPSVEGRAFTTQLNMNPNVVGETTGLVTLASTGGNQTANVANVGLPGLLGVGTGNSKTSGTLAPLAAGSQAQIGALNLGGGDILATAIQASTSSDAAGNDTGSAVLVNLVLAGTPILNSNPAPNTPLLPGAGPLETLVILNEQYPTGVGLTVNAVHIYILGANNPFGLPAGADIILASAFSNTNPA